MWEAVWFITNKSLRKVQAEVYYLSQLPSHNDMSSSAFCFEAVSVMVISFSQMHQLAKITLSPNIGVTTHCEQNVRYLQLCLFYKFCGDCSSFNEKRILQTLE